MGLFNKAEQEKVDEKTIVSKSLYCIDFENVGDAGIIGISKLGEDSEVVIFYGSNNNSISFTSHEMIVLANCKTTIIKCDKSAKNYLDFQLTSYIGMRLGKEQYSKVVIVSKDTGFDSVVDFWVGENVAISRQDAIDPTIKGVERKPSTKTNNKANKKEVAVKSSNNKKTLSESAKKKVRNAVKDLELKPTQYTLIYNTMLRSKTLDDYQLYLGKKLGDKGAAVFEKTKDIFKDFLK